MEVSPAMKRGSCRSVTALFLPHSRNVSQNQITYLTLRGYASPSVKPPRDPRFAVLSQDDLKHFRSIVSNPSNVVTDQDTLQQMNIDWLHKYAGNSSLALYPTTTSQVSEILKYCNQRSLPVVPQGGNTGLVGGSVPVHDEIILSASKMDKILSFDEVSGILTCEAGCILQKIDEFLETRGFMMPLDLGAKGRYVIFLYSL